MNKIMNKRFAIIALIVFAISGVLPTLALLSDSKDANEQAQNNTSNDVSHYYENGIDQKYLNDVVGSGEPLTVYFYDPLCGACQEATPIVFPIAEEMGIDLKPYNIMENPYMEYGIEATPTIIHYDNGQAVANVRGNVGAEEFRKFFDEVVID